VRKLVGINKRRKRVPARRAGWRTGSPISTWNFSVFQSAPRPLGLDQLFPIVRCTGSTRSPPATPPSWTSPATRREIDSFIENETVDETIALHPLHEASPTTWDVLTGAYQDIMGDMHNLFGRVHEVHVSSTTRPGGLLHRGSHPGDTLERVLVRVQYEPATSPSG